MLKLDHLAIAANSLSEGVDAVQSALGIDLLGGGEHPLMGTHNRLLGLGDVYLEVIAINPDAPGPDQSRWFDLDCFKGVPRLTNWICRCDDLEGAIENTPKGVGKPIELARGDLRWRMAVPDDGKLPFLNAFPALIQWKGNTHPAALLPDSGCRLVEFLITHPESEALKNALDPIFLDSRVKIIQGETLDMKAIIKAPLGEREI